jgi:hypothetical protein
MRRLLLVTVLLFSPLLARGDDLIPIAEGTKWEYDSTETLTGSTPLNSVVTVSASKDFLDSKEVVKLETFSGNVLSKTELLTTDEKGIACLARSGKEGKLTKLNPPERIIAIPLNVGANWEKMSEVEGIKVRERFKVVGEEEIAVPAGKFRAIHLHCEDSSLLSIKIDQWFVPGTGFVRETTMVKGPGMLHRTTRELRKLTPAETKSPTPESLGTASSLSTSTGDAMASPSEPKRLTVEVSSDPAGGSKTEFRPDVAHIYVRWFGRDLPENARVRVAWVAEDVGGLVEPGFIIDETETIAPIQNASARFTLARPPDGWAEGKYRLEFYINDTLTETVNVTIR